jgi:hypothetical protein
MEILIPDGDNLRVRHVCNTDDIEQLNHQQRMTESGFSADRQHRHVARVPIVEIMALMVKNDQDAIDGFIKNDRAAQDRLFKRFPRWRCSYSKI